MIDDLIEQDGVHGICGSGLAAIGQR